LEGKWNIEELIKESHKIYELCIAGSGEGDKQTIRAGNQYAIWLLKANRGAEEMELLTKLLVTSKQVLGPHHGITKRFSRSLIVPIHSKKLISDFNMLLLNGLLYPCSQFHRSNKYVYHRIKT
jgi:hypothetical protein